MTLINSIRTLLGMAHPFKRNRLNEVEVLIHKDARRHAAHGFVVASNRALNIKRGEVAIVFPDLEDAPSLTHTLMTDLWEAMHAQGWLPHHISAWDNIRLIAPDGRPVSVDEHEHSFQTPGFSSAATAEARLASDVSQVPAFLRNSKGVNLPEFGRPVDAIGQLNYPRRQRVVLDPTYTPEVKTALEAVKARVGHLDEVAREAAYVRFISIVDNAHATGKGLEFIRDKLNAAAVTILSVHLHSTDVSETQAH